MSKKKWERPKLIVLVRGKPEEMVLSYCKASWESGEQDTYNGCEYASEELVWDPLGYWSDCPSCYFPSAS